VLRWKWKRIQTWVKEERPEMQAESGERVREAREEGEREP